jgi:hypothetical protein
MTNLAPVPGIETIHAANVQVPRYGCDIASPKTQNPAWQGSFIDSKAHVGSNLQNPIAAPIHKNAQEPQTAPNRERQRPVWPDLPQRPKKSSRRAKTLTDIVQFGRFGPGPVPLSLALAKANVESQDGELKKFAAAR